jgi:hypothetical protein
VYRRDTQRFVAPLGSEIAPEAGASPARDVPGGVLPRSSFFGADVVDDADPPDSAFAGGREPEASASRVTAAGSAPRALLCSWELHPAAASTTVNSTRFIGFLSRVFL